MGREGRDYWEAQLSEYWDSGLTIQEYSELKELLKPNFVPQLSHVKMSHDTPYGELRVEWRRDGKSVVCEIQIPDGCSADLVLPGKPAEKIGGHCTRTFEL